MSPCWPFAQLRGFSSLLQRWVCRDLLPLRCCDVGAGTRPWDCVRKVCTHCAHPRAGGRKAIAACASLPSPCSCQLRWTERGRSLRGQQRPPLAGVGGVAAMLLSGCSGKVSDQSGQGRGPRGREPRGEELLYVYMYYAI